MTVKRMSFFEFLNTMIDNYEGAKIGLLKAIIAEFKANRDALVVAVRAYGPAGMEACFIDNPLTPRMPQLEASFNKELRPGRFEIEALPPHAYEAKTVPYRIIQRNEPRMASYCWYRVEIDLDALDTPEGEKLLDGRITLLVEAINNFKDTDVPME